MLEAMTFSWSKLLVTPVGQQKQHTVVGMAVMVPHCFEVALQEEFWHSHHEWRDSHSLFSSKSVDGWNARA
jgi:hypothetical protein